MKILRTLFDHQIDAVKRITQDFSKGKSHSLNDDMGLGKTTTAIVAAAKHVRKSGRGAIIAVVPTSVINQWCKEIIETLGNKYEAIIYHGKGRNKLLQYMETHKAKVQIILTSAGTLNNDMKSIWDSADYLENFEDRQELIHHIAPIYSIIWDVMIVDESHNLRNYYSRQFSSVFAIKRKVTLTLTGTPFNNKSEDMVTPSMLLNIPPPIARGRFRYHLLRQRINSWYLKWIMGENLNLNEDELIGKNKRTEALISRQYLLDDLTDFIDNLEIVLIELFNLTCDSGRERYEERFENSIRLRDQYKEIPKFSATEAAKKSSGKSILLKMIQTVLGLEKDELLMEYILGGNVGECGIRRRRILQWRCFWESAVTNRRCLTAAHISKRINETYMTRRAKRDVPEVFSEMPEMEVLISRIHINDKEVLRYNELLKAFNRVFQDSQREEVGIDTISVFSILTRMRQTLSSRVLGESGVSMFKDKDEKEYTIKNLLLRRRQLNLTGKCIDKCLYKLANEVFGYDIKVENDYYKKWLEETTLEPTSGKFKAVLNNAKENSKRGRKMIIFSEWVTELMLIGEVLEGSGIKCMLFDGSITIPKRDKIIEEFKSSQETTVLLITLGAGSVGLNLTIAQTALFMGPSWNPFGNEMQAMQRIHRIGQNKRTRSIFLYATINGLEDNIQTIDDVIGDIQDKKLMMAKKVLNSQYLSTDQSARVSRKDLNTNRLRNVARRLEQTYRSIDALCRFIQDENAAATRDNNAAL